MKKLLLLFILLPYIFYSQNLANDSLSVVTGFNKDELIYKKISNYLCVGNQLNHAPKDETNLFFVTNIIDCKDEKFIEGYYFGEKSYLKVEKSNPKTFYVKKDDNKYSLEDIYSKLQNLTPERKEAIDNYAKYNSTVQLNDLKDKLYDYIMSFQKYPIAFVHGYPTKDYSMTGAEFKIMNFSSKTIKYITFNFYGKNAVNDKVLYRKGVYNISRKGIGPVEKFATGFWSFDSVWLTDIVQTLELSSVNIQYMDGTAKLVKITDAMWISDDMLYEFNQLSEQIEKVLKN